ncbi:MAG TPA: hypothetical protein VFF30_00330 [Nitrososphaerales archaeon]|nr:hypothetical protein [Nitrososphaerales archaeon]
MLSEINELRKNEQESTSSLKFVNEVINCLQIMTLGNDLLLAEIEKVQGGESLRPVLDSMQGATTRLISFIDAHRKK